MNSDVIHVENALRLYAEGLFRADAGMLNKVFTRDAVMCGFVEGNYVRMTAEAFIEGVCDVPSMRDTGVEFHYSIGPVDIKENIATAVVCEKGFAGKLDFEDCFHLIKRDDCWKIVAKLFHTI